MNVTVRPFGAHAILLDWPAAIDESTHQEILAVNAAIQTAYTEVLVETVITYHAIAVYLKETASLAQCVSQLENFVRKNHSVPVAKGRVVIIPVCYDACFALDIADVAAKSNLTNETLINLHAAPLYPIYFLGFLPGFPYLGGLDKRLHTPRQETPRLQIAAGSIGIGGSQTGIYPSNSPGGWNIIGKTPIKLFDVNGDLPNLLKAGDCIKFRSISVLEFDKITQEIHNGSYQLKINEL